ncbi:hypothetical protein, partial [Mesorhizobium sp.]|uniref:hypothetical protein n=1 Tax=Mesorhizobium sp. TaxID=1871066 RepID=UPI0025ED6C50
SRPAAEDTTTATGLLRQLSLGRHDFASRISMRLEHSRRIECLIAMAKLSDVGPPTLGKQDGDPADEDDNFPICGQQVDMRDLRQVIWHDRPKHRPLLVLVE